MAIKFDLTSITEPVDSAVLQLYVKSVRNNGTGVCTLSAISSDWIVSECSWLNAKTGTPWNTLGGDFSTEGRVATPAGNVGEVENHDITTLVNSFITGTKPNYGFLIEPGTSSDLTVQMQDHFYFSSEHSEEQKRPALVLKTGGNGINNKHKANTGTGVQIFRKGVGDRAITGVNGPFTADLVNLKGQILTTIKSEEDNCLLNIKNFGNGILLLRITSHKGVALFPIAVQ